jgi:hypothetical protein
VGLSSLDNAWFKGSAFIGSGVLRTAEISQQMIGEMGHLNSETSEPITLNFEL